MKPLMYFRKKKDDKLILLEEIAYMLHKPKNGKRITDIFYFGIFVAIRSKVDTRLASHTFKMLVDENYITVDDLKVEYQLTLKGWDDLSSKTYTIIKEHIHGIKISPWMKFKRLIGLESYGKI